MSNPSFPNQFGGSRTNHLQTGPAQSKIMSSQQLAQFSAAVANSYYPKPQTLPGSFPLGSSSNTTETAQSAQPSITTTNPMSEFATSAYQTANQGSTGLQPPHSQPIDLSTFRGFKFVTLDGFQLETREIYDSISGTYQWEMCETQEDRCIKFVREECANKRVFLITSGSLGRQFVPIIHDLPQIYAVYTYCADVPYNLEWANKYTKVRVVCNDDDKYLIPQFAVDVAQSNMEWGDALAKDGKRDKAKKKYEKALKNLKEYARRPDPMMIAEIEEKFKACQ